MQEYYRIVHDERQILKFYRDVLPRLKPDEVYFLSLAARNKYLTEEERVAYDLGRTEMYGKTIIREDSEQAFLRHVYRFECDTRGYTTRSGLAIPQKCIVCYVNIHPSNVVKAVQQFQTLMNSYMTEAISICVNKRDNGNFMHRFAKLDNNLLTCYQQATGTKRWIDFDIDMSKSLEFVDCVSRMLPEFGSNFVWIDTRSGYHLLVEGFRKDPNALVWAMENAAKEYKEIGYNHNSMVPLPGTYQSGYPVRMLEKGIDYFLNS